MIFEDNSTRFIKSFALHKWKYDHITTFVNIDQGIKCKLVPMTLICILYPQKDV